MSRTKPITCIPASTIMTGGPVEGRQLHKFAPTVPAHIYQGMFNRRYVPDVVLLLAHDVVKNKIQYENIFKNYPGLVIMDNSLVELKSAVDLTMIQEACEIAQADVVVLPDVMGDGAKTAAATIDAWDNWKYSLPSVAMMAVLHGSSVRDFFFCAEMIQQQIVPDWISIPRKLEGVEGHHRLWFVRQAASIFPLQPIHLLGFSDHIWHDMDAARHSSVRAIDSAAPFRSIPGFLYSSDPGPRGDWWETVQFDPKFIDIARGIDDLIDKRTWQPGYF